MSASAAPNQGDHVFNAVATAIRRPFETIRRLRSELIDGEHFLHDYLLHSYSLAVQHAANLPNEIRELVASAGAEEIGLRMIRSIMARNPALARINPALLRQIHQKNAATFGAEAKRFELEILTTVLNGLEAAAGGAAPASAPKPSNPGLAYQRMLDSAYDPSAALVVIADRAFRGTPPVQGALTGIMVAIAESMERPGSWKEPYANFGGHPGSAGVTRTATGNAIASVRNIFLRLDSLKAPGILFARWITDELGQHGRSPKAQEDFGAMQHLLHAEMQRRFLT